jgi:hypothetical protein
MALALAWPRKFRTHDLTPVTRPGDGYTDYYHDLFGTLIWRDHSYIVSVMVSPTRKRPPTATDRDRAGYYKDHFSGELVLDPLQRGSGALLRIT